MGPSMFSSCVEHSRCDWISDGLNLYDSDVWLFLLIGVGPSGPGTETDCRRPRAKD